MMTSTLFTNCNTSSKLNFKISRYNLFTISLVKKLKKIYFYSINENNLNNWRGRIYWF